MESRPQPAQLLERLDAIGASLARSENALALIGLGSVGAERDRLDEYSDLDFFVIVQPSSKDAFLSDLAWLERVYPIAFAFANTRDGFKIFFTDGVYAEFAIFVPDELARIPNAKGRVVWQAPNFDALTALARYQPPATPEAPAIAWLTGEILTNLYVGLTRFQRGERLSAMRLIQVHAVDRLLELSSHIAGPTTVSVDPFASERRYEARYPTVAAHLPSFAQGYERSVESALAILAFIEQYFDVDITLKQRILSLSVTPGTSK
jgi:hypothetical protein